MLDTDRSTRRAFLTGRSAVGVVRTVAETIADDVLPGAPRRSSGCVLRVSRPAMACQFEVLLNQGQYAQGTEAAIEALDVVEKLESQLSVFRSDSEVSRLNRSAHGADVPLERRLFALLARAAEIYRATGGAYDITSGPLTKAWGFYRRAGCLPSAEALEDALSRVGMKYLRLHPQRQSVRFKREGMEINLGSIGKGYALDRAAESLQAAGVRDFLIHGGNSSVLGQGSAGLPAAGSEGEESNREGWWVGVRHPLDVDRRIGEIRLRDRALGTSGSGTQCFLYEGRRLGHILDPRDGRPVEDTLSVTVVAPSGADADALATAFFVMGRDATIEYCRHHPGLGAIIMRAGDGGRVEAALWGLADDDWKSDRDDCVEVHRVE